jgi:hypothetical protein
VERDLARILGEGEIARTSPAADDASSAADVAGSGGLL